MTISFALEQTYRRSKHFDLTTKMETMDEREVKNMAQDMLDKQIDLFFEKCDLERKVKDWKIICVASVILVCCVFAVALEMMA